MLMYSKIYETTVHRTVGSDNSTYLVFKTGRVPGTAASKYETLIVEINYIPGSWSVDKVQGSWPVDTIKGSWPLD